MDVLEQLTQALATGAQVKVGWRTNTAPAWEFDLAAIRAAVRDLDLAWPVQVGCANYARGRTQGTHTVERGSHKICVGRRLTAHSASRVLWHELTHAQQAERAGSNEALTLAYRAAGGGKGSGYRSNPYELEARRMEARADEHPLVG